MAVMTETASTGSEQLVVRPLEPADLEDLARLDAGYAAGLGVEPIVDRAGVSFYARSGHAFTAQAAGTPRGFVLAHATWSGRRPTLRVERLVAGGEGAGETLAALVAAVTKSAYDAGVYDLSVELPSADSAGRRALEAADYAPREVVVYGRVLGSRGRPDGGGA